MSDIFAEVTPFAGDPPYATVLDYFSLRVDPVFTTERSSSNMRVENPYFDWGISRF